MTFCIDANEKNKIALDVAVTRYVGIRNVLD